MPQHWDLHHQLLAKIIKWTNQIFTIPDPAEKCDQYNMQIPKEIIAFTWKW